MSFPPRAIVEIVDTCDEWEGIIGFVEKDLGDSVEVFFPFTSDQISRSGMQGINYFTPGMIAELSRYDGIKIFKSDNLEETDF